MPVKKNAIINSFKGNNQYLENRSLLSGETFKACGFLLANKRGVFWLLNI